MIADLGKWLDDLGLGQYAEAFAANHIDASLLDQLTADDLKELGVASLGHRKILLAAIAAQKTTTTPETAAPGLPAPTAIAIAPRVDGERRQVTILFADLCGFTALSKILDPEELHGLLGRYTGLVDDIVKSYGGTVDKHIGDAVMALFGAPIAHGDDPLRAADAALEIHAAMIKLAADLGRPLQAHLGIASGEVIAADLGHPDRRDYSVLGDSVNLAARLVALAGPGQTVIADEVHHALGERGICDPLGEVSVKGLDRPIRVWRLIDVTSAQTSRSLFVGRQAEIAHFTSLAQICRATGQGQALLIRGEAGIGKTRLLAECATIAGGLGFVPHRGLVFDFGGGRGQDPIRAILSGLLLTATGTSVALEQSPDALLADAMARGLIAAEHRVFLVDLLDLPKSIALRALYDAMDNVARQRGKRAAILALVTAAVQRQPVLLIIEDLHWADPQTLQHVANLAVAISGAPALLLMTSRIDGDQLDAAWRAGIAGTPLTTLDLGPLREADALALAGGFIDATQRLALSCVKRAEGNPLFLEQLLHNAEEGADEQVPASIQSLILARLDRLSPRDKRAAQVAAVIGQQFDLATLRALLEEPDYVCAGLIEHGVIRPDGDGYLFAHALIQQGSYSSLLRAHRRRLHHRAAMLFAASDPVLRAQHLDRAEDPAAAAAYQYDRAMPLIERGLALAIDAGDAHALTFLQGELQSDLGDVPAAIASYRAALEIAPDDVTRCNDWIALAAVLRVNEGLQEALELLDKAEVVAVAHDLIPERARLHHLRGNMYFPMGRIDGCRVEHELSLRFGQQSQSIEAEARALGGLGDAAYAQGRMQTARDNFAGCVELSRQQGFGRIEVANRYMIGFSRFYLNQLAEALEDGRAAVEMAARVGHFRAEMLAQSLIAMVAGETGAFDLAAQHLVRARALAEKLGARRFEVQNYELQGRALFAQGQRAEAVAALRRSLAICREIGLQFSGPKTISALAMMTDDADERRALLAEGAALLAKGAVGHNHLWFYRDAMEAMMRSRDWPGVLHYAKGLELYTSAEPLPWADAFIKRARAIVSLRQGTDVAAAQQRLSEAEAALQAAGMNVTSANAGD
jgi:class 3 adenylate cyclase/tetratricopeptide (TPR) repeat protein